MDERSAPGPRAAPGRPGERAQRRWSHPCYQWTVPSVPGSRYALFPSPIGAVGIAWGPNGVRGVQLPERDARATRARLRARFPDAAMARPPRAVARAVHGIAAILAGRTHDLSEVALDLAGITPFRSKVYALTREIPPGTTATYGELAARAGSPGAARAVGQAMAGNPFPILVPCHRVLAADGSPCGFSAGGGVATKLRLLAIEGVRA